MNIILVLTAISCLAAPIRAEEILVGQKVELTVPQRAAQLKPLEDSLKTAVFQAKGKLTADVEKKYEALILASDELAAFSPEQASKINEIVEAERESSSADGIHFSLRDGPTFTALARLKERPLSARLQLAQSLIDGGRLEEARRYLKELALNKESYNEPNFKTRGAWMNARFFHAAAAADLAGDEALMRKLRSSDSEELKGMASLLGKEGREQRTEEDRRQRESERERGIDRDAFKKGSLFDPATNVFIREYELDQFNASFQK